MEPAPGEVPNPLPEDPLPDPKLLPEPKLLPKLELPTGVDVLLAGWPMLPVLPDCIRISVSGS